MDEMTDHQLLSLCYRMDTACEAYEDGPALTPEARADYDRIYQRLTEARGILSRRAWARVHAPEFAVSYVATAPDRAAAHTGIASDKQPAPGGRPHQGGGAPLTLASGETAHA